TTLSKKVAKSFTKKGDIIFVSWRTLKFTNRRKTMVSKELPLYNTSIYNCQKEVSLKGGLFPQDILGFIDSGSNIFHVNPNIFEYPNWINYMIDNGIPVNQDNFHEVRAKSNYTGYFIDNGVEITDNF
ncbi:hypothetical protein OB13_17165, partial [Pontibacter sp. HJ8]